MAPQGPQAGPCKQWLAESASMASCVAADCASLLPVSHRCLENCTCRCHAEVKVTANGLYIVLEYPEAHITLFVADWRSPAPPRRRFSVSARIPVRRPAVHPTSYSPVDTNRTHRNAETKHSSHRSVVKARREGSFRA